MSRESIQELKWRGSRNAICAGFDTHARSTTDLTDQVLGSTVRTSAFRRARSQTLPYRQRGIFCHDPCMVDVSLHDLAAHRPPVPRTHLVGRQESRKVGRGCVSESIQMYAFAEFFQPRGSHNPAAALVLQQYEHCPRVRWLESTVSPHFSSVRVTLQPLDQLRACHRQRHRAWLVLLWRILIMPISSPSGSG